MSKFSTDAIERTAWTAAQAGLAAVTVEQLGLPLWAAAPVGAALAALKALVARKVGDPDSASTLREPAMPPLSEFDFIPADDLLDELEDQA